MTSGQPASSLRKSEQPAPFSVKAGLIGRKIQKSRTPAMHMAEGAALGFSYCYDLLDAADSELQGQTLGQILDSAAADHYAGVNVTYPFKVDVLEHLDEVSEAVEAVGAVNTVVFRGDRKIGHNTDHWGFAENFRQNMANEQKDQAILIGAGGAGGAVGHALAQCGIGQIVIFDIDQQRAKSLALNICNRYGPNRARICTSLEDEAAKTNGIVNASPIGMTSVPGCPFPVDLLRPDMWVADIVYFPLETELLRQARICGCRTLPGSGMAVFQAVRAFEHFTGHTADPLRMKATFDAFDRELRETAQN
ncbi:MAG: shikimate dehydrogenase [Roseibium sp.]